MLGHQKLFAVQYELLGWVYRSLFVLLYNSILFVLASFLSGFGLLHFDFLYGLELFKSRSLVDPPRILQTHLPMCLPQVEESRFALDESSDKVSVFGLVPETQSDIDFSQIFGDPTEILEHFELSVGVHPTFIVGLSIVDVGQHGLEYLLLEL